MAGDESAHECDSPETAWFGAFFDEQNIVNTMQCLLLETSKTIDDLTALCVAMQRNDIVLSLTKRGLMPISSAHMYLFPYTHMNKEQLRSLRQAIAQTQQTFEASFAQDVYIVHGLSQPKLDGVVMLFGASCLLMHGISTTRIIKRGFASTKLSGEALRHHVNATLFHIVHACGMPAGAVYRLADLLRKHRVSIDGNQ